MKTSLALVTVIGITFLCFTCEYSETKYSIGIKNNATHDVRFYLATLGEEKIYPDTTLPTTKPSLRLVKSMKSSYYDISGKWEVIFEVLPADRMCLFIFHPDTLAAYSWNDIRDEYKILKRYDLSLEYLKSNDWIVTYP